MAAGGPKARALRRVTAWEAVERGARTVGEFATTANVWNGDPWLLGTPGGTVDLRTGGLQPGDPYDLISRVTAVKALSLDGFDPRCACPLWMAFLDEALKGDAEAIRFLRMWGGYNLTGITREQVLLFVYGPAGSGSQPSSPRPSFCWPPTRPATSRAPLSR